MFLIPTVQFLYLMATFKRNYLLLRRWVIVQIVAVLPMVLWWLFILQQHRSNIGIGWVPRPQWLTPLFSLWNFSFGYSGSLSVLTVFFIGVMLIGLGLGVWRAWRAPGLGRLLILWLVFPSLIIISLSFGRVSFYVDRYLIIITPVLTILTVSGLLSLRFELLRWGLLSIFMAATLLGLFYLYFDRAHFAKDDWRALARLLDAQAREGEAVIACTDGFRLAFEYYNPHQVIEAGDVLDASQLGDGAALSGYQTAWIVVTHPLPSVHALANNEPPLWDKNELSAEAAEWETHNFLGDVRVPGISAYHYRVVNSSVLTEVIDWRC
jgi:hypothetical protein